MNFPFTVEEFLGVFKSYNLAVWPMHVIAYVLGAAAVLFVFLRPRFTNRLVAGILAFFWIWMGFVYHLMFFSEINQAAYLFGILFVAQGLLLLIFGVIIPRLNFGFKLNFAFFAGLLLVLYAMAIYPIIGSALGHGYPYSPWFGLAPCPATIFTFGLLLWTRKRVPFYLYLIPLIWSIIGFFAALKLGIGEDIGLLIAGVGGSLILIIRDAGWRRRVKAQAEDEE